MIENAVASQIAFMTGCGQPVAIGKPSGRHGLAGLYMSLIAEETDETFDAFRALLDTDDGSDAHTAAVADVIDGCADVIVVAIGMMLALGVDPAKAYAEVMRSNHSKLQPDGTALHRADGKILKPATYSPPDLKRVVRESWGLA